jgi:general secretion pathway protein E
VTAVPATVDQAVLAEAIRSARAQHRAGAGSVLDVLLRTPGLDAQTLAVVLPGQAGVAVRLGAGATQPDFAALDRETAQAWRCVLLRVGSQLVMAAEDPWDEELLLKVSRRTGEWPAPEAVPQALLQAWLGLNSQGADEASLPAAASTADGPIVAFVDQAVRAGFERGASDIHFECDRTGVTAKHRLDGVMATFSRMSGVQPAQEVISRIKVLAQLDITERRLPQDGRLRFDFGEAQLDVRVSIMPSVHGEDAVLRLLDKARLRQRSSEVSLELLGFDALRAQQIQDLASLPSGMLLVTGPTGSGKTTTVYAALSEINTGLEKIITIEDPVEYELSGVLQIPVNDRKGLTFAKGLRSILRHDPDRILVGEIRDAETAEIAVQSALTGHLVFTTVHANSITDVVGRFRHFGLDMFGFMSALNGVVVQRLLRQLCPACVGTREATVAEAAWLRRHGVAGVVADVPVAVGCPACHGSGYKGRFVLAEVHLVDDELRDHVTAGSALTVIKAHAAQRGVRSLSEQASQHVVDKRTTAEEVKRVVGWL